MKSWKEENEKYIKKLKESEGIGAPFTWYVTTGPGSLKIEKDWDLKTQFYINNANKKAIEAAIKEDPDVSEGKGLAAYIKDEKYAPYIDSIIFKEIKEGEIRWKGNTYEFIPYTRFIVTGTVPEDISLEEFKKFICDYVEGQCSDGWGEHFEQQALPAKQRKNRYGEPLKNINKYFSPWTYDKEAGVTPETWISTRV